MAVGAKSYSGPVARRNEFLSVQCGDIVAVENLQDAFTDWWAGQVLHKVGSSLEPRINTIFQVIDIDTGSVKIINADLVIGIICRHN